MKSPAPLMKRTGCQYFQLINRISAEEKVAVVRISHDVNDIQQAEQVLRLEPPEKENKRESA